MSVCVGLTGGIGSGKSTVAALFADLGAGVVDTDAISHQLTQANGLAMPQILARFGEHYVDAQGALHRRPMRELIFSDAQAKRDLEHILHPLIIAEAEIALARCLTQPYTVLVAPLLFENPLFQRPVQRILVVDCPESLQVERVVARSQLRADEVYNIIAQQMPRAEKVQFADDVICNQHDLPHLVRCVHRLHQAYLCLVQQNKH